MLESTAQAQKLVGAIEILQIGAMVAAKGIAVNNGSWGVQEEPTGQVRKYCKAVAEKIFPSGTVRLTSGGITVTVTDRQNKALWHIIDVRGEYGKRKETLCKLTKYKTIFTEASQSLVSSIFVYINSSTGTDFSTNPNKIVYNPITLTLNCRADDIKAQNDYAAWFARFMEDVMAWKAALDKFMVAIPDVEALMPGIEQQIKDEIAAANKAKLSKLDALISGILGREVTGAVELVNGVAVAPAATVTSQYTELDGLRYENVSAEEQARAEDLARRILSGR